MKRVIRRIVIALFALLLLGSAFWFLEQQARIVRLDNALVAAVKRRDLTMVTLLLKQGADPNSLDKPPVPVGNWWALAQHLLHPPKQGPFPTLLMRAAGKGDTDMVRALVEHGADVNADDYGSTALLSAVGNGYTETARYLLDHGADVNAPGMQGNTPIINGLGRLSMVQLLVERGADVNWKNRYGSTAMDFALDAYRHTPQVTIVPPQGGNVKMRAAIFQKLKQRVAAEEAARKKNCYLILQLLKQAPAKK
jgi:ankyrin repeat protein